MKKLIKATGDAKDSTEAHVFVRANAACMSDIVALIPVGGTQISQALEKVGYVVQYDHRYNPARRITKTLAEKQIVKYQLMAQVFFLAPPAGKFSQRACYISVSRFRGHTVQREWRRFCESFMYRI